MSVGVQRDALARVEALVREAVGVDEARTLEPDLPLSSVGFDSLALVNAVAAVESAFDIELPDELWEDRRGVTLEVLAEAVAGRPQLAPPPAPAAATGDTIEQPGVSRLERLYAGLESRGAASAAAARALDVAVAGVRRLASRTGVAVLARDLSAPLPELPAPSGVTIETLPGDADLGQFDGVWTKGQEARLRRRLRRRLAAGCTCLVARESGGIVGYILIAAQGDEETRTGRGTCFGLDLYERRDARGRGIGLALGAAGLHAARDLGYRWQAGVVLARNRPMIAASTQLLGYTLLGRATRSELCGLRYWTWLLDGRPGGGRMLLVS